MKIIDWFKTKINGGRLFEAETDDGRSCSFKIKNVGTRTREIFDKVGDSDCIDALKKKVRSVED